MESTSTDAVAETQKSFGEAFYCSFGLSLSINNLMMSDFKVYILTFGSVIWMSLNEIQRRGFCQLTNERNLTLHQIWFIALYFSCFFPSLIIFLLLFISMFTLPILVIPSLFLSIFLFVLFLYSVINFSLNLSFFLDLYDLSFSHILFLSRC